jgi:hypothetical protein
VGVLEMKLPSLKDIGIKIVRAVLPRSIEEKLGITPKEKPMVFNVGEGMTEEQKIKAEAKLEQVAKSVPESKNIATSLLETYLPAIPETAKNIQAGMPPLRAYTTAFKTGQDKKVEDYVRAEAEYQIKVDEAKGKGASTWEIAKIENPAMKRASDLVLGFMGGIKWTGEAENAVIKLTNALKEAKPLRGLQEELYTAGRAEKLAKSLSVGKATTGEAGFAAEKAQLRGELPKVQFESLREKVSQTDIDSLFNQIKDNPLLSDWEKFPAREGLAKILGESGGKVPTSNEIKLLDTVFGEDFTKTLLEKKPLFDQLKEAGYQLWNMSRSVMSSVDMSAPLRQGAFLIGKPKQFFPAFKDMFKSFFSEDSFQALQKSIAERPSFNLMKNSGLSLTQLGSTLSAREEQFMSSWAEKIPIVGSVVRASGRAYTGFLNKLRADVFDDLVSKATNVGLNAKNSPGLTKEIANFINNATGRGNLGGLERAAVALNGIFFSPRLMTSRLTLLNPVYYIKASSFVRKEALKSLFSFGGAVLTVLGLAKIAGAEVGTDWRSSDFLKIKIGNTRIDIGAGFQQYLRMIGQLYTGEYVSSTTGKLSTLGEGYKPLTRKDIIQRQIESKLSPMFSLINSLLTGQDFEGNKISIPKEIGKRFVPMAVGDIVDVVKDNPSLLPISLLGLFGVGIQTYKPTMSSGKGYPSMKSEGMKVPPLKGIGTFK